MDSTFCCVMFALHSRYDSMNLSYNSFQMIYHIDACAAKLVTIEISHAFNPGQDKMKREVWNRGLRVGKYGKVWEGGFCGFWWGLEEEEDLVF